MKKIKRKNLIRRNLRKKNSNAKHLRSIYKIDSLDDTFFDLLYIAFQNNNYKYFSQALNYGRVGYECKDCDRLYSICKCEGGRELDSYGNTQSCEECSENYCICDYLEQIKKGKSLQTIIIELIIKLNDKKLLREFEQVLEEEVKYSPRYEIWLKKIDKALSVKKK